MRSTSIGILALVLLATSGCYSTTQVQSRPSGANVTLDNKQLGATPLELEEKVWLWTSHSLKVSKPGYQTQIVKISGKLQPVYLLACCTGVLAPVALVGKYDATYVVDLVKEGEDASAPVAENAAISFPGVTRVSP